MTNERIIVDKLMMMRKNHEPILRDRCMELYAERFLCLLSSQNLRLRGEKYFPLLVTLIDLKTKFQSKDEKDNYFSSISYETSGRRSMNLFHFKCFACDNI